MQGTIYLRFNWASSDVAPITTHVAANPKSVPLLLAALTTITRRSGIAVCIRETSPSVASVKPPVVSSIKSVGCPAVSLQSSDIKAMSRWSILGAFNAIREIDYEAPLRKHLNIADQLLAKIPFFWETQKSGDCFGSAVPRGNCSACFFT